MKFGHFKICNHYTNIKVLEKKRFHWLHYPALKSVYIGWYS